jgi:ABC-2 type transport system permease protein
MTGAGTGTGTEAGARDVPAVGEAAGEAAGPERADAAVGRTGDLRAIATIAGIYLRLAARDRVALFFVLVLPVALITIIGSTFGGAPTIDVAVVDRDGTEASRALVTTVDGTEGVDVEIVDDDDTLRRDVRMGSVSAGLVVPAGYGAALAGGDDAVVRMVADPTSTSAAAVQATVRAAVGERAVVVAAGRAVAGDDPEAVAAATGTAADLADDVSRGEVVVVQSRDGDGVDLGAFDYTAPANLVLFTFVNTLVAGAMLATDRRQGITRRMLATPHGPGTILAGIGASKLLFALVQSALIVVVGAVVFGVDWGDPLGAALVVILFALVATGVGLFVGATVREPEQAQAVGTPVAIGLGMLGGCMWPLEIVPPIMQTIGHVTPQAWAMDAWIELIFDGAGVGGILVELTVLAVFALVLGVVAARRLRRVLTR